MVLNNLKWVDKTKKLIDQIKSSFFFPSAFLLFSFLLFSFFSLKNFVSQNSSGLEIKIFFIPGCMIHSEKPFLAFGETQKSVDSFLDIFYFTFNTWTGLNFLGKIQKTNLTKSNEAYFVLDLKHSLEKKSITWTLSWARGWWKHLYYYRKVLNFLDGWFEKKMNSLVVVCLCMSSFQIF